MKPSGITSVQWRLFNLYFLVEHFIGVCLSKKFISGRRRSLFQKIAGNQDIANRGEVLSVFTIDYRNGENTFPDKNQLLREPVLFRGAAANWLCMTKWTQDFFYGQMGDYSFDLKYQLGFSDEDNVDIHSDLGSFIKTMKSNPKKYLRFSKIIEDRPELKNDLDLSFIEKFKNGKSIGEEYYFFMGEAHTITGLHTEVTQTLTIQVEGKKKWVLFAPQERFFFNPVANRMNHFLSHINPDNPDLNEFPIYKYVKRYEIILEPGDALWFPAYYWHYVENLTPSIGIAYKHLNLRNSFEQSKLLTALFFLRTKPTVINPFAALLRKFKN